ncbi:MAG TPA: lipase secretion chaperone [Kofleriaceae bacterium]|nr:lipase secretion chaperone [Kofleriaceae bacterium]
MARRVAVIVGGAAALIALAIGGWRAHRDAAPADPATTTTTTATAGRASGRAGRIGVSAHGDDAVPAALPGSLEGTEADGDVQAGADGHLRVTIELRRLFDHFLAASGEEPIATMRARIIAALRARLPATAASEAIAILDRYLGYREAARKLATAPDPGGDPALAAAQQPSADQQKVELKMIHDLRVSWFTPVVFQAFFADEEAGILAAMDRRDVIADKTLGEAERAQKLAALEAQLPADERARRAAATAPLDEMKREAELRAQGASAAQINDLRTQAFGADGAARLAELDRAHAAWDQKLAQFRADRAAVLGDARLSQAARDQQIAELVARAFTPQEQLRVVAIEHLPASQTPARP